MEILSPGVVIKDNDHAYTLKDYIGSGSYGEVWRAIEKGSGNEIAIKFYIMLDERGRKEFMSEYEIAYGLSHKNLLTASYIGTWQNRPFLVMRYCPKGSSARLVGDLKPSPENERIIWHFIRDVASGLAYLHAVDPDPIVHQDIKPDNILLDSDGTFVITDFGISKKIRSTMRSQSTRAVTAGAVAYMGPERFASQPAPIMASDIWSLGASIYELAMGELPFSGQGGNMLRNGADMPELVGGWSEELNRVIQKCLAKEPWNRIRAHDLAEYAKQILGESEPEPGPVPFQEPEPYNPHKTVRKLEGNQSLYDNPFMGDESSGPDIPTEKKKGKATLWIGIVVAASVAWAIVYFVGADRREARSSQPYYATLLSECEEKIEEGSTANYEVLLEAKEKVSEIMYYDSKYGNYYPEVFNNGSELNALLESKLVDASYAWTRAAKSQARVGNTSRAIDYYKLAVKLHTSDELSAEYEAFIERMAYMQITDIEFRNESWSEVIDDYGTQLVGDRVKYLAARICYNGLAKEAKTVDLKIKIIDPNGNLKKSSSSPSGYTFEDNDNTIHPDYYGNDKISLKGWGNDNGHSYYTGTYRYEIWYKDNLIYTKNLELL